MTTPLPIAKGRLIPQDELKQEYRRRKSEFEFQTIEESQPIPEGWTLKTKLKRRIRIKRVKPVDVLLEDKTWSLLYEFGASPISSRDFAVILREAPEGVKTKQLDVVAVDGSNVFVVECKSRQVLGKTSLKKDIAETKGNMHSIRTILRKILGTDDLQIIFVYATENIIWDENDRKDAELANIVIWDEYDIDSLKELTAIAGEGAKYQIYNRLFSGKKIKGNAIKVPALRGKMGGHVFYTFALSPEQLLKIAYVHRRGSSSYLELKDSYQRNIRKKQVNDIADYIEGGGFFPGSIIINFTAPIQEEELCDKKRLATFPPDSARPVSISLPPYYGSAWVIDGQHRLYGFADLKEKRVRERLPVVAFTNLSTHLQAKIFVDINENQKAIQDNLLWDLYEDLYAHSTVDKEQQQYAISRIAKALNADPKSPLHNCIAVPKENNNGNITLAVFCRNLMQQRVVAKDERLLFCDSYDGSIQHATDRLRVLFDLVRRALPAEWRAGDGHYVCTNAGITVLIAVFKDILRNLEIAEIESLARFESRASTLLAPLTARIKSWSPDTVEANRSTGSTSAGSIRIRRELTRAIVDKKTLGFTSRWLTNVESLDAREEDRPAGEKAANYWLDQDEGDQLEFKGSLTLDWNRYFFGDGKLQSRPELENEVLQAIGAFLNTKGGVIVIGALEHSRFSKADPKRLQDFPPYKDKYIVGVDQEYAKERGWDGFRTRLTNFIETRIGPEFIDGGEVQIRKLLLEDKELCLIEVTPSENKAFVNDEFYIRRNSETKVLRGKDIDEYWQLRK